MFHISNNVFLECLTPLLPPSAKEGFANFVSARMVFIIVVRVVATIVYVGKLVL
jgi:hypothetical protein